jgi:very-long-chain enoyl-CoA reductase
MFNFVSFPNYFFEILSWTLVCVMTNSIAGKQFFSKMCPTSLIDAIAAYIFLAFSAVTMTQWAVKKHRLYKKEFGKAYPRGRKAIIPFIL